MNATTTAAAIFVGAVLAVAAGCLGLVVVGLVFLRSKEAFGRSETARRDSRLDACRHGRCNCSRPAEPDRDALLRTFRESGWIDVDTVRRYSR